MSTQAASSPSSSSSSTPFTSGSTASNVVSFNWSISRAELTPHLTQNNTWKGLGTSLFGTCLASPLFSATSDPETGFQLRLQASNGTVQLVLVNCDIEQLKLKHLKLAISGTNVSMNEKEIVQGIVRKGVTPPAGCLTFTDLIKLNAITFYTATTCFTINCTFAYTKQYLQPLKRLSEDLASLCKRPRFTDMTIVCFKDSVENDQQQREPQEFPVHRAILAARSSVFETMFSQEESRESLERRIEIPDIVPEVMEALLDYLYSGNTAQIDQYAIELLIAADKYDIQCLLQLCIQSLITNRQVDTACEVFYIADLHKLDELKDEVQDFISRNPSKVLATEGWDKFIMPNQTLMKELYGHLANRSN